MSEEEEDVGALTVAVLRERLREANLSSTGNKADLVARLRGALPPREAKVTHATGVAKACVLTRSSPDCREA
jgi:hypothetical protein